MARTHPRHRVDGIERAAALHAEAVALADVAARALDRYAPQDAPATQYAEERELAARLRVAAAELVPGWLGAPLTAYPHSSPLPSPGCGARIPRYVRLGTAHPLDDSAFPAVVPLLDGGGNLAIDADARDARTAGLLRSLVLRLVAATPAGSLRVRVVDPTGAVFAPFGALASLGIVWSAPDQPGDGLRAAITDAEEWVRRPGRYTMLVVIAGLPELTEAGDLARLTELARRGPSNRLHLVVAGWPPPPLTEQTTRGALPCATQVVVRNPHALVGDPPGGSFGGALNSPVYLDPGPPADTIQQVCAQVAAQLTGGSALSELLPRDLWRERGADGVSCVVGHTGETPLYLHLAELTPHWLIGGGPGSGKTSFLTNVLYGLSTRYGPDQLRLYLQDLRDGESFSELASAADDPSWVPQAYAVGAAPDREYALAVLEELLAELAERERECADAGVRRYADLPALLRPPRVVCVIDEFPPLLLAEDRIARAALRALETLARRGRGYGIHLVLAARSLHGLESLAGASPASRRDSLFGQFPVRVALPGGGAVLETRNLAATELSLGTAVVNTAGGLGGPVGAMRAHERLVRFPDAYAEPEALAAVRHRLWASRPPGAGPPHLFTGYEREPVPETLPAAGTATAYLGRMVDVRQSLAAFPLDRVPGRHLAVLGPSEVAADLLYAAGVSLSAAHRPGTIEFLLASFHSATEPAAGALAARLERAGHRVRRADAAALKEAVADPELSNVYIIGFALDTGPSLGLEPLLRRGPQRGVHLFGWWRGLRRFGEDTGGSPEEMAGLVLLNIPAADAAQLLGDPELDWQPRAGRALLRDQHSGRTSVIIPFLGPA